MIVVRPAVVADSYAMSQVLIASITQLCAADHRNDPEALARWLANKTPEGVRRWFDNPEISLFIAERHGEVAAVGGISAAREVILNYVAPKYRFTGVSRRLLGTMEETLGPGEASLISTVTARRFYLAMGWADAGEIERYAGMIAYALRKAL